MNFIDLFSGAGGLTEGFINMGFNPIAHVEMDYNACKTLETRSAYHYYKNINRLNIYKNYQKSYYLSEENRLKLRSELIEGIPQNQLPLIINEGITNKSISGIFRQIDAEINLKETPTIDLIIGGPPCQAYSLLGRARDQNHMENDERNYLYKLYARFLVRYQPKIFIFENVPGLLTAKNGLIYKNLKALFKRSGYNLKSYSLNANEFEVPQNRKRIILMGVRKDIDLIDLNFESQVYPYKIKQLLSDLPPLQSGEKCTHFSYQKRLTKAQTCINLRIKSSILTHHDARKNNERDLKIYYHAVQEWDKNNKRIKYSELDSRLITHNNVNSFLDRFKVIDGNAHYSHTIVAHLSKDGHHFIHPDINQNRSITVREAARIQSFPDDYFFEGPRTSNFVQIGNAVPPLMAKKIAEQIKINYFPDEIINLDNQ